MSPITIPPINSLNIQKEYGTFSVYAQNIIKSQIKSTYFALEKFFSAIDSKLISENEQKLKEMGFKQIGKNIKEGVLLSDNEYDYHVFSSKGDFLDFDIIKSDDNELSKHFKLKISSDNYMHAGNFSGLNIEDEISKALDYTEFKLSRAKMKIAPVNVTQPFIKTQDISDKLKEINRTLRGNKKITDIKKVGFVGPKEEELIGAINEKLTTLQELYKRIPDLRTKYKVRSSYENYMPESVANKLGFKNIGPYGESISLFRTSYKNNSYIAIKITDTYDIETQFVVSQNNKSVRKNLPSEFVRSDVSGYRLCLRPKYYTQKEVDDSDMYSYLLCLKEEMDKYIKYTQDWFAKKEEIKLIKSNYDTATLDQYKDLLDDIHSNFKKYQTKMRKYLRKPHKSRKFKTENNISTKITTTAVKFDNITPDGYDLRLSYPKVHEDTATQLLVMRGDDKIEKSFYILNNKLLRFNIKDLNDKFSHYDSNKYYYDKKYLQESNLHSYLLLLQEKLHELNEKLDAIREKQIQNRIKYHIKTSKEELE